MARMPTPLALYLAGLRTAQVQAQSAMVVGLRMAGMAGVWAMPPSEWARMVTEKQTAFAEAGRRMAVAAMSGASPLAIQQRGMQPISRKVRGNARRLSRKVAGGGTRRRTE